MTKQYSYLMPAISRHIIVIFSCFQVTSWEEIIIIVFEISTQTQMKWLLRLRLTV